MGLFWDRLKDLGKKKWEDMTPQERQQEEEFNESIETELGDEDITEHMKDVYGDDFFEDDADVKKKK